jgi:TetR/AcrR family transcriptional regulator
MARAQPIDRFSGKASWYTIISPVAVSTDKAKNESAKKILSAAEVLFAKHGFAAVSVRDIATKAGVNKALVFYYYDNKAKLLDKVLEQYYEAHAAALDPEDNEGTVRERLHGLLNSYLDFIEDNYHYLQIVQHELVSNADNLPMIRTGMRMLYDRVEELLGHVTGEGPLHVKHFYMSFSGLVVTYFNYAPVLDVIWKSDPLSKANRKERREHLRWMMNTILDGLEVP